MRYGQCPEASSISAPQDHSYYLALKAHTDLYSWPDGQGDMESEDGLYQGKVCGSSGGPHEKGGR